MSDREQRGDAPGGPRGPGRAPPAATYATIGIQFALSLLLFLFLGQWLDRRLGTGPWLTLAGVFLGAGASFYGMYRRIMAAQERAERDRDGRDSK